MDKALKSDGDSLESIRLMEEIRARVAEKKASGFYREEEIDEISRMELLLSENEGYGEEADRLISWLHGHWEATGPVDRSEGFSPGKPLRRAVKSFLTALLRPLSRLLLGKQNQINSKLVQLVAGAVPPTREGLKDLEERVDHLALRMEENTRRITERLDDISSRLERQEGKGN